MYTVIVGNVIHVYEVVLQMKVLSPTINNNSLYY